MFRSLAKSIRKCFIFFTCPSLLLVVFVSQVRSQNLDTIKLNTRISVMGDKVTLILPTKVTTIKSDRAGKGDESWVVWETAEVKLLLFVQKINSTDDNNLFDIIAKADQAKLFKTKMLPETKEARSMLSIATKLDSTQNAILINRLLVRAEDGTTFTISSFISSKSYKARDGLQLLTEKIFTTLKIKTDITGESTLQGMMNVIQGKSDNTDNLPWIAGAINSLFKSKKKSK